MSSASRQLGSQLASRTKRARSTQVKCGRLTERLSTLSCCRSSRFFGDQLWFTVGKIAHGAPCRRLGAGLGPARHSNADLPQRMLGLQIDNDAG